MGGIATALAAGISAGAATGAELFGKSAMEQERMRLQEEKDMRVMQASQDMKEGAETKRRGLISEVLKGVPSTAEADGPGGDKVSEPVSPGLLARNKATALSDAGYVGPELDRFTKDADRIDDNARADKKQTSEDLKWKTQFEELSRHHKAIEDKAAAEQGLKGKDREELSKAMESYTSIIKFRGLMTPDTPVDQVAQIDASINAGAARLSQFGIKVPGSGTGKGDPLSSVVAGARFIDSSMTASDEDRAAATSSVSQALKQYGSSRGTRPGKYPPGQILEKADGSRWQVDSNGTPQPMKK